MDEDESISLFHRNKLLEEMIEELVAQVEKLSLRSSKGGMEAVLSNEIKKLKGENTTLRNKIYK